LRLRNAGCFETEGYHAAFAVVWPGHDPIFAAAAAACTPENSITQNRQLLKEQATASTGWRLKA
jgi:hypothetical protein